MLHHLEDILQGTAVSAQDPGDSWVAYLWGNSNNFNSIFLLGHWSFNERLLPLYPLLTSFRELLLTMWSGTFAGLVGRSNKYLVCLDFSDVLLIWALTKGPKEGKRSFSSWRLQFHPLSPQLRGGFVGCDNHALLSHSGNGCWDCLWVIHSLCQAATPRDHLECDYFLK